MSHDQKRTSWYKEALYATICGILYGGTNTVVGHPFDTIKTKMIAQSEHIKTQGKSSYFRTIENVYKTEGAIGFYRGWIPPFMGSILYRSTQFAVFEAAYTKM